MVTIRTSIASDMYIAFNCPGTAQHQGYKPRIFKFSKVTIMEDQRTILIKMQNTGVNQIPGKTLACISDLLIHAVSGFITNVGNKLFSQQNHAGHACLYLQEAQPSTTK